MFPSGNNAQGENLLRTSVGSCSTAASTVHPDFLEPLMSLCVTKNHLGAVACVYKEFDSLANYASFM